MDEGRVRIRESAVPARSLFPGKCIRNGSPLVSAPSRLYGPT
jgi:hypothetical protein